MRSNVVTLRDKPQHKKKKKNKQRLFLHSIVFSYFLTDKCYGFVFEFCISET